MKRPFTLGTVARPRPNISAASVAAFRSRAPRVRTWSVARQHTVGKARSILRVIGARAALPTF
jgi:hypothetical protein